MPRATKSPKPDGPRLAESDRIERRLKALRDHEGRWVAWNETGDEVLASAETYEDVAVIARQIREASPSGKFGAIVEFIEPPMRMAPGVSRREVSL